jgi:hypothetical protein
MEVLRINFADFWQGFIKTDNYFYNLLSKTFTLEISDDPEILFHSCYGTDYLKYNCLRIFYSAENLSPDFTGSDFAMTFGYIDDPRHYRFPLYGIYIDKYRVGQSLQEPLTREKAVQTWNEKKKFCCMVVSNGLSKRRIDFFQALSAYQHVDSGGRYLNNVGGPIPDKLSFIRDYRFVLAFENSAAPGYTTEKILEPLIVSSIPLYWGNPLIGNDFNTKCFVNVSDFTSDEACIRKILEIESNPDLGIQLLMEPKFPGNKLPESVKDENVLEFLLPIIYNRKRHTPVAQTSWRTVHLLNRKKKIAGYYLHRLFKNPVR